MILNEIIKNMRLIFRNWVSFLFLILGPLMIITIIGLTFAGDNAKGLWFGVYQENKDASSSLPFLTELGNTVTFDYLEDCIKELREGRLHLCVALKSSQRFARPEDRVPDDSGQVTVTFYYDLSRKQLSSLVIGMIQQKLGKSVQDISLETTKGLLEKMQDLVLFLKSGERDITGLIDESHTTEAQLDLRGTKLRELRTQLTEYQKQVNQLSTDVNEMSQLSKSASVTIPQRAGEVKKGLTDLENAIRSIQSDPSFSTNGITGYTLSGTTVRVSRGSLTEEYDLVFEGDKALLAMTYATRTQVSGDLDTLSSQTATTNTQIQNAKTTVQDTKTKLDTIATLMDNEIAANDAFKQRVVNGRNELENVQRQLKNNIGSFAVLDSGSAESIIRPVLDEYVPLSNIENIQIVFPGVLVIVIVFITILFATILTLSEINGPAYFRNLLAPRPNIGYPIGILLTNMILVFFQITVLLIIAQFLLGVPVIENAILIYTLSAILIFSFTLIGMCLSFLIKNTQTTILASIFTALGLYLFSGMMRPLELMPTTVAFAAHLNPVVIAEDLFRLLLSYGIGFSLGPLMTLFGYAILLSGATIMLHERFVHKMQ